MVLTVTFKLGTNLDIAQVQVQNRVAIAQPLLPAEVQRQGIIVKKASPDITLGIAVYSPDGSRDPLYVSNYVTRADQGRNCRAAGRGRSCRLRRPRLLDAAVAEPGATGVAAIDGRRLHCGRAGAERAGGGGRRRRPTAEARHGGIPVHGQRAGTAHRAGAIRRHRRQDRGRRQRHPRQGRGAASNWAPPTIPRAPTYNGFAGRRHRCVPVAGHQLDRDGRTRSTRR